MSVTDRRSDFPSPSGVGASDASVRGRTPDSGRCGQAGNRFDAELAFSPSPSSSTSVVCGRNGSWLAIRRFASPLRVAPAHFPEPSLGPLVPVVETARSKVIYEPRAGWTDRLQSAQHGLPASDQFVSSGRAIGSPRTSSALVGEPKSGPFERSVRRRVREHSRNHPHLTIYSSWRVSARHNVENHTVCLVRDARHWYSGMKFTSLGSATGVTNKPRVEDF